MVTCVSAGWFGCADLSYANTCGTTQPRRLGVDHVAFDETATVWVLDLLGCLADAKINVMRQSLYGHFRCMREDTTHHSGHIFKRSGATLARPNEPTHRIEHIFLAFVDSLRVKTLRQL